LSVDVQRVSVSERSVEWMGHWGASTAEWRDEKWSLALWFESEEQKRQRKVKDRHGRLGVKGVDGDDLEAPRRIIDFWIVGI